MKPIGPAAITALSSTCVLCGGANSNERVEIGYTHCTKDACVATWRRQRSESKGLVLVARHKQGPAWIYADDVPDNSYRRDGGGVR